MKEEIIVQALRDAYASLADMLSGVKAESFESVDFNRNLYEYGYRSGLRRDGVKRAFDRKEEIRRLLDTYDKEFAEDGQ